MTMAFPGVIVRAYLGVPLAAYCTFQRTKTTTLSPNRRNLTLPLDWIGRLACGMLTEQPTLALRAYRKSYTINASGATVKLSRMMRLMEALMKVNCGKSIEVDVATDRLPQAVVNHATALGLKNMLTDAHAGEKDRAKARAKVEAKL